MGGVVLLALIGAAAGFVARKFMDVQMTTAQAVIVGIIGALIGGFIIRYIFPVAFAIIGGAAGAALLIYLFQRYRERQG